MKSRPRRRQEGRGAKAPAVPPMYRGFARSQVSAEVSLSADAIRRVEETAIELGEEVGYLQEQVEWCRQWIGTGELAPKDALTAMRGLSKVLEQIKGRNARAPVPVHVDLGELPTAPTTGDALAVH